MGGGKFFEAKPPVFNNIGIHNGDDIRCPLGLFGIQAALVVGRFPSINLLQDVVNQRERQSLVPKSCISGGFNFGAAFARFLLGLQQNLALLFKQWLVGVAETDCQLVGLRYWRLHLSWIFKDTVS